MSTTDPRQSYDAPNSSGAMSAPMAPRTAAMPVETRKVRETKPFLLTTEFWAMVAGVAGLAVLYNVSDEGSLTMFRACLLAIIVGSAYIVSRGLAKSGSQKRWDYVPSDDRR